MRIDLDEVCKQVTGKPLGTYIDNGHYIVSRTQAKKLCGGDLPRHGYEKTMRISEGKPDASFAVSTHEYIIARTHVSCRMDISAGEHWSIREYGYFTRH